MYTSNANAIKFDSRNAMALKYTYGKSRVKRNHASSIRNIKVSPPKWCSLTPEDSRKLEAAAEIDIELQGLMGGALALVRRGFFSFQASRCTAVQWAPMYSMKSKCK